MGFLAVPSGRTVLLVALAGAMLMMLSGWNVRANYKHRTTYDLCGDTRTMFEAEAVELAVQTNTQVSMLVPRPTVCCTACLCMTPDMLLRCICWFFSHDTCSVACL